MPLGLRKATVSDASEYLRIVQRVASLTNHVASNLNEACELLANSTTQFILVDAQYVGLVAFQLKAPGHAYISEFAIDPAFQGRGLGSAALSLLLAQLESMQIVELMTHPENPARRLYARHGFKITASVEDWEGRGPRLHLILSR